MVVLCCYTTMLSISMTLWCHNTENSSTYNSLVHHVFLKFTAGTVWHMSYPCYCPFKVILQSGCSTIFTPFHSHSTSLSSTVTSSTIFRRIPIRSYLTLCMITTLRVCEAHFVCVHAWLCASVLSYWQSVTYFLTDSSIQQHIVTTKV